jgi:hypothetical protein
MMSSSPTARLIPEATVDAWSVATLTAQNKRLRFSCPTPRQQAQMEPWDILVDWPTKRFMIESKAVRNDGKIEIPAKQLEKLVELELTVGTPVFYGLPAPDLPKVFSRQLVECRFNPDFETWHRILRPSEVRKLVGTEETLTVQTVAAQPLPTAPSLRQFLADLKECDWVPRTERHHKPEWTEGFARVRAGQVAERQPRPRDSQLYSLAVTLEVS